MLSAIKTCLKRNVRRRSKNVQSKKETKDPNVSGISEYEYKGDTRENRVYVWGLAEHGALGMLKKIPGKKELVSYIPHPKRLSFAERYRVVDIACGYGFTAFAVNSKDKNILYGSGINTDAQLGYDESQSRHPQNLVTYPRVINLPIKDTETKVLNVAAGRAHLIVLTTEGVFTLGNNAYGQCGRPVIANEDYKKSRVIHHIPDVKGQRIKAVSAGQDHSILLTESGEVYTFGWGADGQTGLAHYRNEHRPSLVKGDLAGQHIVKVACVADCVLALSDKGKVFGWGNSEYGQLPLDGENRQINIATELTNVKELGHITDIATGGCFCMVLNNAGNVYVWGYGILGLGPNVQQVSEPTQIPPTLFGQNAYEKNTRVINVYCGMSHLAALTNIGDLYMWGCNKFGSLGLGHKNDQFFPLKVNVGAYVKKVACGIDHTVTICRPFV